jgi:hypothetical protein
VVAALVEVLAEVWQVALVAADSVVAGLAVGWAVVAAAESCDPSSSDDPNTPGVRRKPCSPLPLTGQPGLGRVRVNDLRPRSV